MDFKLVNFCEIDEYAVQSYCAIHNVNSILNLGDICSVDISSLPVGITLLTHGSPCTSFSRAGYQLGGDRGSGTPSSLMWNSVEIIRHSQPKFVIWENVSNVLAKKHKHNFEEYLEVLNEMGYNSYYEVLNGYHYGLPQHRERIFVISIHKSIDKGFGFPLGYPLVKTFRDYLEPESDILERHYLNDEQIDKIHNSSYDMTTRRIQTGDYVATLCARDYKGPKCVEVDGKVRQLTPREYWRLMGFSDADFDKTLSTGVAFSHLYKQAGNSIAYNVIKEILLELCKQYPDYFNSSLSYLSLFSGVGAFEMALRDI